MVVTVLVATAVAMVGMVGTGEATATDPEFSLGVASMELASVHMAMDLAVASIELATVHTRTDAEPMDAETDSETDSASTVGLGGSTPGLGKDKREYRRRTTWEWRRQRLFVSTPKGLQIAFQSSS
jgi:hypothetical protein